MDSAQVTRALYKVCLIAATRLGKEVERHYTSDVFAPTEVGWLLQNIPAVLSGVKNGTTGLTAVVRDEFRQRGHLTTDAQEHRLDLAVLWLQMVNQRIPVLQRHAASPVSDTLTNGVRVIIRAQSRFKEGNTRTHLYRYDVRIRNESCPQPVQLMSRHWLITDFYGRTESIRGPGVVGQHPVLNVGEEFSYASATTIKEMRGTLAGTYHMLNTTSGELFDVAVGPLALRPE